MSLTLVESAKRETRNGVRRAVIELFAKNSDLMRVMPFKNIQGNAYKYDQEAALPGIGFRGINEAFASQSEGVINPAVEQLVIAGGDLDVDMFLIQTQGSDVRASRLAMKIKALAHQISHKFIKGDSTTTKKEFDGLQVRLSGSQKIAAGSTSGGDALSLEKLDELIDAVDDPSHLLMSKAMRRKLTVAARNTSVGGYITYEKDAFGRRVTVYNDLPILIADGNADQFQTLAFDEANPGGGANVGTSIYCLGLGDGKLQGIQSSEMQVRRLGEIDEKSVDRTRIEWYVSPVIEHSRAAARLWGIKDAAVAA